MEMKNNNSERTAELRCIVANTPEHIGEAFKIRRKVFMEEQGVPGEIEMDELDSHALHMLCLTGEMAVATGRLNFFDGEVKIGRVAVLKRWRNRGIGGHVVRFLIEQSRIRGAEKVYANVQTHTKEFYKIHGFREVGDVFMEAGIEHIRMEKIL